MISSSLLVVERTRKVSRFKLPIVANLGAIVALSALTLSAPAYAAPSPDAAVGTAAASSMAKDAGLTEPLPPNVTVTIIPSVPKVNGPTDIYREGAPSVIGGSTFSAAAAATLPFNFVLQGVSGGLWGRLFKPSKTTVCTDIAIHAVRNAGVGGTFYVKLYRKGDDTAGPGRGKVSVPRDGVARSYCWSGVNTSYEHLFHYGFDTGGSSGVYEYVDGSGTVRNP
jgi:hypothetical protein